MGLNNKDRFATKLQCRWFVTDFSEAFNQCVWKLDCTKIETSLCIKMHCFRRICIFCSLFMCISLNGKSSLKKAASSFFFFFQKKTMSERWKLSEQNWICHVAQHLKDTYLRTERKWQSATRQGLSSVLHACSHLSWVAWKPQSACWSVNFIWRIFYGIVFFPLWALKFISIF